MIYYKQHLIRFIADIDANQYGEFAKYQIHYAACIKKYAHTVSTFLSFCDYNTGIQTFKGINEFYFQSMGLQFVQRLSSNHLASFIPRCIFPLKCTCYFIVILVISNIFFRKSSLQAARSLTCLQLSNVSRAIMILVMILSLVYVVICLLSLLPCIQVIINGLLTLNKLQKQSLLANYVHYSQSGLHGISYFGYKIWW